MAVPSYDDLLARQNMDHTLMELTFKDEHLRELASNLESCEILGMYLEISDVDIQSIMSQGKVEVQRIRLLKHWKQWCGSAATHRVMVTVLLQIKRTDLAEKVIALRQTLRDTSQSPPCSPAETSLATPASPVSSYGIEDMSPLSVMPPSSIVDTPTVLDLVPALRQLEEEFLKLVNKTETILEENKVQINVITKWFRMLPQSIRRRYQTDENYREIRQKILDSRTVKELFDHLTGLKHWSYMMPETLTHILGDVKIDDIHQIIDKYRRKLTYFKMNTKLRELINTNFPVPDYCMELTMEVEGWEDKTIQEVESSVINTMRQATYSGHAVSLGLKKVNIGSITLTFIIMESVELNVNNEKLPEVCKDEGIVSIQIDGENLLSNDQTKVPHPVFMLIKRNILINTKKFAF